MSNNIPTSPSSSSSSELFFSESENSVDALLEEQDNIIDELRQQNEKYKKENELLVDEIKFTREVVRKKIVLCLKALNDIYTFIS